jgi:restriction system protein
MSKKVELTKEEKSKYLKEFYEYFTTGYEFEEFLKIYLEKIGLDEVSVTKIRELKGVIPFGHKGIFITTAKFSKDAIEESKNDVSKPVILIDGENLLQSCIDNELGFVFKPMFSKDELDLLHFKEENITDGSVNEIIVERQITANDIRARILVVPKVIMNAIPKEQEKIFVKLNKDEEKELNIDKGRRYLAGVTDFYREFKLLAEDGSCNPKKAIWKYCDDMIKITLKD